MNDFIECFIIGFIYTCMMGLIAASFVLPGYLNSTTGNSLWLLCYVRVVIVLMVIMGAVIKYRK